VDLKAQNEVIEVLMKILLCSANARLWLRFRKSWEDGEWVMLLALCSWN